MEDDTGDQDNVSNDPIQRIAGGLENAEICKAECNFEKEDPDHVEWSAGIIDLHNESSVYVRFSINIDGEYAPLSSC